MIKFFVILQQQLLSNNKIGEYLTYTIGEIVLLVIGIFICVGYGFWLSFADSAILGIIIQEYIRVTAKPFFDPAYTNHVSIMDGYL